MNSFLFILNFKIVVLIFCSMLLALVMLVSINLWVDYKGVYKEHDDKFYIEYAKKLLTADAPLVVPENDRYAKYFVGKIAKNKTYLLGSSKGQLTSELMGEPLINLTVAGSTYEDFLLFLGMLLDKDPLPKKVYWVIDPWCFHKNSDVRYREILSFYRQSLSKLGMTNSISDYTLVLREKLKHLISFKYFWANIKFLWNTLQHKNSKWSPLPVDEAEKWYYTKDGAEIYSLAYERERNNAQFPDTIKKLQYKLEYFEIQDKVVEGLTKAIHQGQKAGIEFVFIVMPYHPIILQPEFQAFKIKLDAYYQYVLNFAKINNIPVIGNISPACYSLKDEDYYDGIHIRKSGLAKMNFPALRDLLP